MKKITKNTYAYTSSSRILPLATTSEQYFLLSQRQSTKSSISFIIVLCHLQDHLSDDDKHYQYILTGSLSPLLEKSARSRTRKDSEITETGVVAMVTDLSLTCFLRRNGRWDFTYFAEQLDYLSFSFLFLLFLFFFLLSFSK